MSRGQWGTFYLVAPEHTTTYDDEHVLRAYPYGPSSARIAEELLRVAGDDEHGDQIATVLERAHEKTPPVLDDESIAELLTAIAGLEDHVHRALLDQRGFIRDDKLAYLRSRSELLDLDESNPSAPLAVVNAFSRVAALRVALEDARKSGLHITMG